MKEYDVISNLVIETKPEKVKVIEQEILDAIIEVVERHDSFVGGGFHLFESVDVDARM